MIFPVMKPTTTRKKSALSKATSLTKVIEDTKVKAKNLKKHIIDSQRHLDAGFSDDSSFAQEEFNAEIYEMSPVEASDILKYRNSIIKDDEQLNTNRRIDPRIVERIKDEILNNDWYEEAANVAFNKEGTLIDGQHTLAGIIAANTTVKVLLKTGCRAKAVQKIDVSRVRNLGQRLKFSGALPLNESDAISKFRADMAGLICRPSKNGILGGDRNWFSDAKVIKAHNSNIEGIDYFVKNAVKTTGLKKNGIFAPMVKAYKNNPKKVKDFYNKFLSKDVKNVDCKNNSPIKLRNLVNTINQLKSTKTVDGNVYKQIMNGRSEIKFWFKETTRAVDCFINNKTYTPSFKR